MTEEKSRKGRIAFAANADLQRAAIRDRSRNVNSGCIFREADRLVRRSEQGKIHRRMIENGAEYRGGQIGLAGHERQFGIDLTDQKEVGLAPRPRLKHVERHIGVARWTVAFCRSLAPLAPSYAVPFPPPTRISASWAAVTATSSRRRSF